MAKIVRYEFMGNWLVFWLLCVFFLLIPLAFLYWATNVLRIEEDLDEPERFVEEFRVGKLGKRKQS